MSITLTSFLKVALEVALTLAAVRCGAYVVRRVCAGQLRIGASGSILSRNAHLKAELDNATRTADALQAQLRQERERAQQEVDHLHQEASFWRRMEELVRGEIWRKDDALQQAEVRARAQDDLVQSLQMELRTSEMLTEERVRSVAEERDAVQALLDVQHAELLDAQKYLVTADAYSETDVVQMIRDLNLEISRLARRLTDSFHVSDVGPGSEHIVAAYERTREAVGPIMAELLESIHHQDDPILVHIALQADMVGFAAGIISAWDFQHQSNAVFSGIHRQMLKSETQAVAGRWRALTRQYSKQRLYNGRDLTMGFTNQLAERLSDILVVAGANMDAEQMRQTALQNLEAIIRQALRLQQIIGEEITSRDFEIFLVRIDDVFDFAQMEDVYNTEELRDDNVDQIHVLCTAELGLRRCEKAGDDEDGFRLMTLVKPKVVLETLVYQLGLVEEEDDSDEHGT
ncbi:hypothetical protein AcW1_003558 [Taiwanofungus camphoratus]|nr:hypothetical protein AcW1_003558 [Antrodia cinnamomea]